MSDFRFANPSWSHGLWLMAALVILLVWLNHRSSTMLQRFLSITMQTRLVHRVSPIRRWTRIAFIGITGICLVLAMMRPQWGLEFQQTPRVGAQIMVCLDVSKSMFAEDTAPNRLERAKAELADLLSFLEGDQIGLTAFAGRATVLCPLTPDFGFFKLILDSAGPHSVGRGGTRLEEPIRKALDGFQSEADVSRAILLITDGEDHDSHPLDAAKAAAERGIKILAIGFGDEAGSEIEYTDPQTGAKTFVLDHEGKRVITRLDGETLREMALATEGAYIPAGTGALDLRSIYAAHIAPLMRGQLDDQGRAIRQESYQWPILVGILFLILAVATGSGSVHNQLQRSLESFPELTAKTSALLLLSTFFFSGAAAQAQSKGTATTANPPNVVNDLPTGQTSTDDPSADASSSKESADPRKTFNESLAFLDTDVDKAERLLESARRQAGTDAEVRYRAAYNMGWVEIKRADKVLAEQPQEALQYLEKSANWFREAIRLRPDNTEARHNLDVVLRRILELADALAQKDDRNLQQRLDELIETQRSLVASTRDIVNRVAAEEIGSNLDQYQADFRKLAVEQRTILSESQAFTAAAREELNVLEGKQEKDSTSEDKLRIAQLTNLLHYTNRANQRLGQSRSQMRRRQAKRAFRRAAAGLTELKRARDQLRNPVETLDMILREALPLTRLTSLKAAVAAAPIGSQLQQQLPTVPQWVTNDYLSDTQQATTERTTELVTQLQAGLDEPAAPVSGSPVSGPPTSEEQKQNAPAEKTLAAIRAAMPFLTAGEESFQQASQSLTSNDFLSASNHQIAGITSLRSARERFLDLRGLIELAHAEETQLQSQLSTFATPSSESKSLPPKKEDLDQLVLQLQGPNLDRTLRIAQIIDEQIGDLPPQKTDVPATAGQPPGGGDPQTKPEEAERQRLRTAKTLAELARQEMQLVLDAVQTSEELENAKVSPQSSASDDQDSDLEEPLGTTAPMIEHVDLAVEHLQSLRRLFFSIVEHLRETTQSQAELNDQTEQLATLTKPEDLAPQIGPVRLKQQELQAISQQIATALDEQAKQTPTAHGQPDKNAQQQAEEHQISEQFEQASQLVAEGSAAMSSAVEKMATEQTELDAARSNQNDAWEKLAAALALLQPPQQQQQQQQQEQQQEQQQQQEQESEQTSDASQLLQAVRDREAQRRKETNQRNKASLEPVEKDW